MLGGRRKGKGGKNTALQDKRATDRRTEPHTNVGAETTVFGAQGNTTARISTEKGESSTSHCPLFSISSRSVSCPKSLPSLQQARPAATTASLQAEDSLMKGGTALWGTASRKYQITPLFEPDKVRIILHLTGMQCYAEKATEELRFEDYTYNEARKRAKSRGKRIPSESRISEKGEGFRGRSEPITDKTGENGPNSHLSPTSQSQYPTPPPPQPAKRSIPSNSFLCPPHVHLRQSISFASNSVELRVTPLSDQSVSLLIDVSLQCQIADLKEKIWDVTALPRSQPLLLFFQGKPLQDSLYLSHFALIDGDSIDYLSDMRPTSRLNLLAPLELLPRLTLAGYITRPGMGDLARMTSEELTAVGNFVIENEYGRVEFAGEADLTGVDLDAIIRIERHCFVLYPGASLSVPSPKGINLPATVFLYGFKAIKAIPGESLEQRLIRMCEKLCARYDRYDSESGELVVSLQKL